ncbi:helix-turn-helix domain-containing protein [Nonomuraea glycinis]|uniref:AraC family transcriptional regulator n=1 Tax=Nonomuraea glycinis TaxID=2047744 RepID=A0A918A5L8_9ACTN|nr:helix-turn-helix domain-containing protein [Nonomuraea glycinis]MCA2177697.1 helix-turn-helix domain-containing protein [Nonomuraea glycinis]GGP06804.1 AraC family transcriptional regulator [Nonomuraea glycinis]
MRTFVHGAAVWGVACPRRPSRVDGVTMAGFRVRDLDALRMVPHPAVTLLLEFGAGSPVVADAAGRQQRGSIVAGPGVGSGGAVWARGENVECVQVRLSPVIARAVLGVSPADLDGAVVVLDDLWGGQVSRIGERLSGVSSWQDRFALMDELLARRHEAGPPVDPEVAWAWHRIVGSRGLARVDGLAAEVGWSRKRLWSRFRSQLGLPPKRAGRLVRFDHAAHRLVAGDAAARVAADAGYVDQSHLHREVRAFTGATPATVAGEPFLAVDDIAWPGSMTDGENSPVNGTRSSAFAGSAGKRSGRRSGRRRGV